MSFCNTLKLNVGRLRLGGKYRGWTHVESSVYKNDIQSVLHQCRRGL